MSEAFLFEAKYRGNIWRFQILEYEGQARVSVWPWYEDGDGQLRPGTGKYGKGGFQFPIERLGELSESIGAWCDQNAPEGAPAVS